MTESVTDTRRVDWWLVVPVKGGASAKTRLTPPPGADRRSLARALALDTVEAAVQALGADRVLVVTGSGWVTQAVTELGVTVVADPGRGLNEAARAGIQWVSRDGDPACDASPAGDASGIAVLLGDLPAARAGDLHEALRAAGSHPRAMVADRHGTGTVLLTALSPHPLVPQFGPGSAARHTASGHRALPLQLPRLRTDVDDSDDLAAVLALGVGRHTATVLGLPAQ